MKGVGKNSEGGEGVRVGKSWVSLKQEAHADAQSALYLAWSIATDKRLMGIRIYDCTNEWLRGLVKSKGW